jgi:FKBP-type peptidyl-prolyl cis-trans isomerase
VVPPLLGYGRISSGPVPGGSVLVYDIELVHIVGVTP